MKIGSYLRVGFNTTLNIILYAATTGKYLWLEGRVSEGIFRNWARRFRYTPIMYAEPSSEQEIVEIVRDCAKARVFGSGHSFNEGNVSDEVLISLDNYSGLVSKDPANRQITVRGGTRVRDVSNFSQRTVWPSPRCHPTMPRASQASFRQMSMARDAIGDLSAAPFYA